MNESTQQSREDESWFSPRFLLELVKIVLISLAIILPVRYFLLQPFYVKGASMEPTFEDHEYLLIDELSFRFREPERGEVVVFRYPKDPSQFFIKRIVGLPNERVEIRTGRVFIVNASNPEGFFLDESEYLNTIPTAGVVNRTLGADEYFVLGDNRTASLDSRSFGLVARKFIVGRTWVRAWPIARWSVFDVPAYSPAT